MSASQWRITGLLGLAVAMALACLGVLLWLVTEWTVIGAFWLVVAAILAAVGGYILLYLRGFFRFQPLARLIATETPTERPPEAARPTPAPAPEPISIPSLPLTSLEPATVPHPGPLPLSLGSITQAQLRMDEWQIRLLEVHVTPEVGLGDKNVQLIVDVTNVGQAKSTFTGYTILLLDAQGRTQGFDLSGSCDCAAMHRLEMAAFVDPGDTVRTCVTYCVPLDAHSFTTEPMSIVHIWEGGLAFEVP